MFGGALSARAQRFHSCQSRAWSVETGRLAHEDLGNLPKEVYSDLRRGLFILFWRRRHIALSGGLWVGVRKARC